MGFFDSVKGTVDDAVSGGVTGDEDTDVSDVAEDTADKAVDTVTGGSDGGGGDSDSGSARDTGSSAGSRDSSSSSSDDRDRDRDSGGGGGFLDRAKGKVDEAVGGGVTGDKDTDVTDVAKDVADKAKETVSGPQTPKGAPPKPTEGPSPDTKTEGPGAPDFDDKVLKTTTKEGGRAEIAGDQRDLTRGDRDITAPEFTAEGDTRKEQVRSARQSARDFGLSEDVVNVRDGRVTLEQEAQRQIAEKQLEAQVNRPLAEEDIEYEGGRARLSEQYRKQQAVESARRQGIDPVAIRDVKLGDEQAKIQFTQNYVEQQQRTEAAGNLDEQYPNVDIGPGDVAPTEGDKFQANKQIRQEIAGERLKENMAQEGIEQDDIKRVEYEDGKAVPVLTDEYKRERGAEMIEQDEDFLPYHDDIDWTTEDVRVVDGQVELSEEGQSKVREAKELEAFIEIQHQTDADLQRNYYKKTEKNVDASPEEMAEYWRQTSIQSTSAPGRTPPDKKVVLEPQSDIEFTETDDGEFQASLSEAGERKVEIERARYTDTPYVGGFFKSGALFKRGLRKKTQPAREKADEVIPGDQEFYKGAAAAAPVAVAEPSPFGELSVGTALVAGATITSGTALTLAAVGEDPEATGTAKAQPYQGSEIAVPEGGEAVRKGEIGVPAGGEVTGKGSELSPTETPLTGQSEIAVTEGATITSKSEIGTPAPTGTTDPRILQTQMATGVAKEKFEEDKGEATKPTIPAEEIIRDITEPDQPGPSNRERQRRDDLLTPERTFPTGAGAVVGYGVGRLNEAQSSDVYEEPLSRGQQYGTETELGVSQQSRISPLNKANAMAETDVMADVAQQQTQAQWVAQHQALENPAEEVAEPTEVAEEYPYPYGYEFGYGYGYEYPTPTVGSPDVPTPKFDLPNLKTDKDEEKENGLFGEREQFTADFLNPLTGERLRTENGGNNGQ